MFGEYVFCALHKSLNYRYSPLACEILLVQLFSQMMVPHEFLLVVWFHTCILLGAREVVSTTVVISTVFNQLADGLNIFFHRQQLRTTDTRSN
jgi:hypothetical protein